MGVLVYIEVLEEGRQESLPTILCEPDSLGGRSRLLSKAIRSAIN